MKEGWTYKKLGEICDVSAGQGAPQGEDNYCEDGIPFVKAGNVEELLNGLDENNIQKVNEAVAKSHKLKLYRAGSVVFAKSGMSCMKGLVYTLKNDCYVVSHLAVLTPKEVLSSFLNYTLNYFKPNTLVKDEAYPSISLSDISQFCIPVPPIKTQSHIVSEFDLLQSIIDKQQAQLKELGNLAQSVFYNMFGDPSSNNKGWKIIRFDELLKPAKNIRCGERHDLPVLSITMRNGIILQNDRFNKVIASRNTKDYKVVKDGQFVIAFPIDEGLIYPQDVAPEGIMSPAYNVWDVNYSVVNRVYLNHYFHCSFSMKYYRDKLRGTTQRRRMLSKEDLLGMPILLPPLALQQSYAKKIEIIEKQKANISKSIEETQKLFDYTMDKYFG